MGTVWSGLNLGTVRHEWCIYAIARPTRSAFITILLQCPHSQSAKVFLYIFHREKDGLTPEPELSNSGGGQDNAESIF